MSVRKHDYNAIDWHSFVYYDTTSPSGLRWKVDRNSRARANQVAGHIDAIGRWLVTFNKKKFLTHNIVFILNHGPVDIDMLIDHIDGNHGNNHIENLRAISPTHNQHNRKISERNVVGVSGIYYLQSRAYWVASIGCNKVTRTKSFSCKKYGNEKAKQMAIDFAIQTRMHLNASGKAAFTDRHIGIDTSINSSSKQENTLDACFQQD